MTPDPRRRFPPGVAASIRRHAAAGYLERPIREVALVLDPDMPEGEVDLTNPDEVRIHPRDWVALCEVI
jgi:hypothetical protein